ncbi:MAG: hypothetical protein IJV86_02825 [Clostridia bacterium]|nr:hypothetical protein [Clostridia bacterium]
MLCCKCDCGYLSIIVGIIAGVVLGILFSFGLIATGIIFWVFLAIGLAGVFLSPLYFARNFSGERDRCFCGHRRLILITSLGTIISAALGLILEAIASVTVVAIVLGFATAFSVALIVGLICLARCLCNS